MDLTRLKCSKKYLSYLKVSYLICYRCYFKTLKQEYVVYIIWQPINSATKLLADFDHHQHHLLKPNKTWDG